MARDGSPGQAEKPYTARPEPQIRARPPRISREDIFAAADALLIDGNRPSIERVRLRLGRGSPNKINEELDAWWRKLGSRLRDLPGGEFPQLPQAVGQRLLQLWNEALSAAHESLQDSQRTREETLLAREQHLESQHAQLARDQLAIEARSSALQETLTIVRAQLEEANQRARALEATAREREEETRGYREHILKLTEECDRLIEARTQEHANETAARARLQEQHAAAENRWLTEVDRARQALKQVETRLREQQSRLDAMTGERDRLVKERLQGRARTTPVSGTRARRKTHKARRAAAEKSR